MLGIILGVMTIALGFKAFTPQGLPLTKKKSLAGSTAKVIGVICILLGLMLIVDGVFSTKRIIEKATGSSDR